MHEHMENSDYRDGQTYENNIEDGGEIKAAKERYLNTLKTGEPFRAEEDKRDYSFLEEFKKSKEVYEVAEEGFINAIERGDLYFAGSIKSQFPLSDEFIKSKEVQKAAETGYVSALKSGQMNFAENIKETFPLSDQIVKSQETERIAEEGFIIALKKGDSIRIEDAQKYFPISDEFLSSKEVYEAAKEGFANALKIGEYYYIEDIVKKFSFSKEFFRSSEIRHAAESGLINMLKKGYYLKGVKQNCFIPNEFFNSKEAKEAISVGLIKTLKEGNYSTNITERLRIDDDDLSVSIGCIANVGEKFGYSNEFIKSKEAQQASKEGFIEMLKYGYYIPAIKENFSFSEEFMSSKEVQQAACEGFAEELKDGKCKMDIIENCNLSEEFLRSEEIQQLAKDGFIIELKRWSYAKDIKEKCFLKEEFINSEQVRQAAEEGFISALKSGEYPEKLNENYLFTDEFIGSSKVKDAAKEGLIGKLKDGDIYDAEKIWEKISFNVSPQELINESAGVQDLLSEFKKISPKFYEQALKSVDIVISLFSLSKNSKENIDTIKENPFLIKAVSQNPRFGSKLLAKYPEFDMRSKENIKFVFEAKSKILEGNSEIDPESKEFRAVVQEKLKDYKNNSEILKRTKEIGIDTEQWLNYSATMPFSLDSRQSKISFSETIATPINRIKETIDSYISCVKEKVKKYKTQFSDYKIKVEAKDSDKTETLIKRMEEELLTAKSEGKEGKVKGIENGIINFKEKAKKIKEVSLWDKVTGEIKYLDIPKRDLYSSHENVIKAEKKLEEYILNKEKDAEKIVEAKKDLAGSKQDLKEKFALLEKRVEDFQKNFFSIVSPVVGKGEAVFLMNEIQDDLSEQFIHYNNDRSTLTNLFSEKADKDKEKLENRSMSIFTWARNPDKDSYQGNYSPCCISIESGHFGNNTESTIADYETDLGIQIVNIWDNAKNEPVAAAWCWIGEDKEGNPALVVDNIEANTLYSSNYSEQLTNKLFAYLKDYAVKIGARKVLIGSANNDLPVSSRLEKMDFDSNIYKKAGGYNRKNGYYLEAEEKKVKVLWKKPRKKAGRNRKRAIVF